MFKKSLFIAVLGFSLPQSGLNAQTSRSITQKSLRLIISLLQSR